MAQKPLEYAVARATAKAYNAAQGNQVHACAAMSPPIARGTMEGRIRTIRNKWPSLLKAWPVMRGQKYAALHTQPTLEQATVIHRHQADITILRSRLKEALSSLASAEDRIKDLEWSTKLTFKPAEWTLPTHPRRKREHMPYVLGTDYQIGEVVKAEETEAGYGYSPEIFRSRFRRLVDAVNYLSFEHVGKSWKYPGLIYARGGDTIDGNIHPEDNGDGVMKPVEACEVAFEEESAGIEKWADAFGHVDVKSPGGAGNHDRTNKYPVTKKAWANSYDRLIYRMIAEHFRNDRRVTFQTSRAFDVRFPIYNQQILLTHGDRLGSKGGTGFIGPLATIMRGAQKTIAEQAALGFHIDRVDHGHFHTPGYFGWVLSNGCMPGYSEFAKSFRMRPSPPQQFLLYHHPKRGVVDIKPIMLAEAT